MPKALPVIDMSAPVCCAPVAAGPISDADALQVAMRLKALADPARLRLISIVAASEGAEACVCDLTEPLGLSQPTVSHHLKVLVDAGYLVKTREGRRNRYSLVDNVPLRHPLERIACKVPWLTRGDTEGGAHTPLYHHWAYHTTRDVALRRPLEGGVGCDGWVEYQGPASPDYGPGEAISERSRLADQGRSRARCGDINHGVEIFVDTRQRRTVGAQQ